jgi:hypothetical protein
MVDEWNRCVNMKHAWADIQMENPKYSGDESDPVPFVHQNPRRTALGLNSVLHRGCDTSLTNTFREIRGLSKKYPTLSREKKVLYLGGYNT